MRRISSVLIPVLLSLSLTGYAQQQYKIRGMVDSRKDYEGGHAYLYYFTTDTTDGHVQQRGTVDSCRIESNTFKFEGSTPRKRMGFFLLAPKGTDFSTVFSTSKLSPTSIAIYLENGEITARLRPEQPRRSLITGTTNNNILQESRPIIARYFAKEDSLKSILATAKGNTDEGKRQVALSLDTLTAERTAAISQIIRKHPGDIASLDLLVGWIKPLTDLHVAQELFGSLDQGLKAYPDAARYQDFLRTASNLVIGAEAPNFSLNDPQGNPLELTKYRGKYLLLDFWASWCMPCRQDNPNLVRIYNTYKSKNFEILGVSLDGGMADSKDRWIKAIETDKLTWPQVSDLKGWSSPIAADYLVEAIPMNYLLDPDGKIIAKNLRGEDLEKELSKITL